MCCLRTSRFWALSNHQLTYPYHFPCKYRNDIVVKEFKGYPGPWIMRIKDGMAVFDFDRMRFHQIRRMRGVSVHGWWADGLHRFANAQLIASAPELLKRSKVRRVPEEVPLDSHGADKIIDRSPCRKSQKHSRIQMIHYQIRKRRPERWRTQISWH